MSTTTIHIGKSEAGVAIDEHTYPNRRETESLNIVMVNGDASLYLGKVITNVDGNPIFIPAWNFGVGDRSEPLEKEAGIA